MHLLIKAEKLTALHPTQRVKFHAVHSIEHFTLSDVMVQLITHILPAALSLSLAHACATVVAWWSMHDSAGNADSPVVRKALSVLSSMVYFASNDESSMLLMGQLRDAFGCPAHHACAGVDQDATLDVSASFHNDLMLRQASDHCGMKLTHIIGPLRVASGNPLHGMLLTPGSGTVVRSGDARVI